MHRASTGSRLTQPRVRISFSRAVSVETDAARHVSESPRMGGAETKFWKIGLYVFPLAGAPRDAIGTVRCAVAASAIQRWAFAGVDGCCDLNLAAHLISHEPPENGCRPQIKVRRTLIILLFDPSSIFHCVHDWRYAFDRRFLPIIMDFI